MLDVERSTVVAILGEVAAFPRDDTCSSDISAEKSQGSVESVMQITLS